MDSSQQNYYLQVVKYYGRPKNDNMDGIISKFVDKYTCLSQNILYLGIETARSLALHGAHVVMANRNIPASEKLRDEILAANVS
jgi:hypothetical protein